MNLSPDLDSCKTRCQDEVASGPAEDSYYLSPGRPETQKLTNSQTHTEPRKVARGHDVHKRKRRDRLYATARRTGGPEHS